MRRGVTEQTRHYAARDAAVAASLLAEQPLPAPAGRPALVALMGLPGAGKSHLGRLLARRLGAVVVASDQLRRRLFVAPAYTPAETRMVFAVAHEMARQLLAAGHVVIFDATNLRERDRRPLYVLAAASGARLLLARVVAPEPEVYARLERRRARGMPEDASDADERVYEAMRERYEEPSRPYVIVDTTADLGAAVGRVGEMLGS